MKLPGAAWTALILALVGVFGGWLTEYVDKPWVPLAILGLSILAKAAEIIFASKDATPELQEVRGVPTITKAVRPTNKRATWLTLLFG